MNKATQKMAGYLVAGLVAVALTIPSLAADKKKGKGKGKGKGNAIKTAMQKYHKAPKGTDPICKKASSGAASKEEIGGMLKAYQAMAKVKPSKGDQKSWEEKTAALIGATEALNSGAADGVDKYKAAVNCKACHSVHKG